MKTSTRASTAGHGLRSGWSALTLLVAALGMSPHAGGLDILINGKFFGVLIALVILGWMLKTKLTEDETRDFLWESWKFVKQIFPLLVVGVFAVGVIRALIKPEWIETLAGQNTLLGNLAGVVFGVFMYFPTLVEVPIAQMFLSLGMHRGPLLAYLMADPELSLQSILIISTIIGRLKSWTYVGWVALFSTLAGLIYGAWVDGASIGLVALYLFIFLALLSGLLWFVNRRNEEIQYDSATNLINSLFTTFYPKEFLMITIKVLGSGCANCKRLEQIAHKVVEKWRWKPKSSK